MVLGDPESPSVPLFNTELISSNLEGFPYSCLFTGRCSFVTHMSARGHALLDSKHAFQRHCVFLINRMPLLVNVDARMHGGVCVACMLCSKFRYKCNLRPKGVKQCSCFLCTGGRRWRRGRAKQGLFAMLSAATDATFQRRNWKVDTEDQGHQDNTVELLIA